MSSVEYAPERPGAAEFFELFETTGWNRGYGAGVEELERALAASWYVVVARESGQLVGVGRVVSDGVLYGMIYDMIVHPEHQNRGIGSALLCRLVDRCRAAGLRDIQLFSARGKAPFYRKRGFVERPDEGPGMSWNPRSS